MYDLNLKRREMERRMKKLEASKRDFSEKAAKGLHHLIHTELYASDNPEGFGDNEGGGGDAAESEPAVRSFCARHCGVQCDKRHAHGVQTTTPFDSSNQPWRFGQWCGWLLGACLICWSQVRSDGDGNDDDDDDDDDYVTPTVDDGLLTAAEILKRAERNKRIGDAKARQLRAGRLMDRGRVSK